MVEPIGKKLHFSVEGHCQNLSISKNPRLISRPILICDVTLDSMGAFTYTNTDALEAGMYRVDFDPARIVLYDESDRSTPIASVSTQGFRVSFYAQDF